MQHSTFQVRNVNATKEKVEDFIEHEDIKDHDWVAMMCLINPDNFQDDKCHDTTFKQKAFVMENSLEKWKAYHDSAVNVIA